MSSDGLIQTTILFLFIAIRNKWVAFQQLYKSHTYVCNRYNLWKKEKKKKKIGHLVRLWEVGQADNFSPSIVYTQGKQHEYHRDEMLKLFNKCYSKQVDNWFSHFKIVNH